MDAVLGLVAVALLVLVAGPGAGAARAAPFPPLPLSTDRQFLTNLTAPTLAPGGSGVLTFTLADPGRFKADLDRVRLALQVYAFNGFPNDASATLPVANAPILSNATASGLEVNVTTPTLAAGSPLRASIGVTTSSDAPAGAFAVRTALSFELNGTAYRLESRGWFSAATWAQATELPNGSATVNLSVLGVSGVLPETAVLVHASDWAWALGALLAGAFALLAAGAWYYWRRGPGSSSGAA